MNDAERAKMLGEEIRQAREALGMTQQQLAEAVGCSKRTIWGVEHGEPVSARNLVKIWSVLGLPGDELATRAAWVDEARVVVALVAELLAGLPEEVRLRFRRRLVQVLLGDQRPGLGGWPDDVEVIADMLGAYLARSDQAGPAQAG